MVLFEFTDEENTAVKMNKSFAAVNTATIASKMTIAAVNYGLW